MERPENLIRDVRMVPRHWMNSTSMRRDYCSPCLHGRLAIQENIWTENANFCLYCN